MTKPFIYLSSLLVLLCSCHEKADTPSEDLPSERSSHTIHLDIDEQSSAGLQEWFDYYHALDSTFSYAAFTLEHVDTVRYRQGNVWGIFDEEFPNIYTDFLVFSPNKKQYIDFDSYLWALDDNQKPEFSPDQEINLVNVEDETITRIGFNGPSHWLEHAVWKNDSIVFLCEYESEKMLRIIEFNIQNKERRIFLYPDTLDSESKYFDMRLTRRGINFD